MRAVATAAMFGALALSLGGCSSNGRCTPGFDAGERFRLTVLGEGPNSSTEPDCLAPPLEVGTTMVLTAGQKDETESGCEYRFAAPIVPEPYVGVLTSCPYSSGMQLGLECRGTVAECPVVVRLGVAPHIERDDRVIEDGDLYSSWFLDHGRDHDCVNPGCVKHYRVRIERLPPEP